MLDATFIPSPQDQSFHFVTADDSTLCACCVRQNATDCHDQSQSDMFVTGQAINVENDILACDHCTQSIPVLSQ